MHCDYVFIYCVCNKVLVQLGPDCDANMFKIK